MVDSTRRYQEVQDYSLLAQEFPQERLSNYLEEVPNPVFGVRHYWCRFEFAKSRGQIHFRLFAICADQQPRRHLHEVEGGESQEVAGALANWARGALSLTALHPAETPEGALDLANVRAPDGEWAPQKDSSASALLFREAESFRAHHIACANSYCFHGCGEYCMRAPRKG